MKISTTALRGTALAALLGLSLFVLGKVAWLGSTQVMDAPDPQVDELILLAIATIALLLVLWLTLAFSLAIAALVPGALGASAQELSERLTPRVVQRAMVFLLGIGALSTFAPGTSTSASGPVRSVSSLERSQKSAPNALPTLPSPGWLPSALPDLPSPGWVPSEDADNAPSPSPSTSSEPTAGPSSAPTGPSPSPEAPSLPSSSRGKGPSPRPSSDAALASEPTLPSPGWRPSAPTTRPQADLNVITGTGRSRGAAADPEPTKVVVRQGDTLWDLASAYLGADASPEAIAQEWPRWYEANREVIGSDPHLLRPGQVLNPPPSAPSHR